MLNKIINYQFLTLSLLMFFGCSPTVQQAQDRTAIITSDPTTRLTTEKVPTRHLQSNLYYYAFNQQKFWATVPFVRVGVEVFDISLNEYAYVTNKVVAVLEDSSQFDKKMFIAALKAKSKFVTPDKVNFHFSANSVVEFSFTNKKVNMLEMYQVISAMPNVSQAELLLRYRGRNSLPQY